MPYIPQDQRVVIDPAVGQLVEAIKKATVYKGTAFRPVPPDGAMNYAMTRLVTHLLLPGKPSYLLLERAVGLLDCVKMELYRKVGAPYEDEKESENGEVHRL